MPANGNNVEYFVALITCEDQVFAAVINDPHGTKNSDGLLEYAKRIAVAKFGHFICGKQYKIELLAAYWPPVIRATAVAPNEPDGVTYAGQ